jgi:hemoglobin-like flavoprotein
MKTGVEFAHFALDIETSLHAVRDCGCERFAGRFYQLLFEGFPELKDFFAGTDMQGQAAMLTMAIQVVVQHYRKPRRSSEDYLKVLGNRHRERGVSDGDYQKFEHALLVTLTEFHGDDWHDRLEEEWCAALQQAFNVMVRG